MTTAIDHHCAQLESLSAARGGPVALQRLQDYIQRDKDVRKEHGLARVGRLLRLQMARAVAAVYSLGVLLVLGGPHPWLSLDAEQAVPILGRTILWMLPGFIVLAVMDWLASRPAANRRPS